MDKFEREHEKYVALMQKRMNDILDSYEREITRLAGAVTTDPGRPFRFADYPALKARYDKLIKDMEAELQQAVESGVKNEWDRADKKNDALAIGVVGSAEKADARGCLRRNGDALTAFIGRKAAGMTLSDRVWLYTNQYDAQIQAAIDVALIDGKSAAELSRDVRSYLVHPDTLFRRVRDERGVLHLSQNAKAFHPGQGMYRSAYMNARRMAATEINMAYRTSDYMRIQQMDFVVGIEVHLSGNHNCKGIPPGQFYDICDELQGKYPKTFKFTGWHPHCYDDKSEVYTDSGWKLFKDVEDSDLILSLDPKTRNLEYVPILLNISRPHKGKMVHFHNRSYSQLVTPEHEVLYVSKGDNETFKRVEADKCGKTQPIYRSCEWVGEDVSVMSVGGLEVPFVLFAEFMGYWLADGSLGHKYEVGIAQQDANRENIYRCIERMGMHPRYNGGKVEFNNREFYEYLKQFGKAAEKYVPAEIKESAKESICAFLDAFISCDGHIKEPKPFVGSRGSLCVPKEGERVYCTTSRRMADDIGELVLKKGVRPSFSTNRTSGKMQRFKNGMYRINHDIITIRECRSQFATQYSKDYVDYNGIVYDLTLAKNNTMYIRREGKCFWGSNCRCYTTTILKSREEMKEDAARIKEGKSPSKAENSPQAVTKLPDNFTKWLADNQQRVATAKRLPYFLKDNGHMEGDVWVPFQKIMPPAKPISATTQVKDYTLKAKTIAEAELEISSRLGVICNLKGFTKNDIKQVQDIFASAAENIDKFPELKDKIKFVGTMQGRKELFVQKFYEEIKQRLAGLGFKDDLIMKTAKKNANRYAEIKSTWYAYSAPSDKFGLNSVAFNATWRGDRVVKQLENDLKSKFHPEGCATVKAVFDHELGHKIDETLGLRKNADFDVIYTEAKAQGNDYIRDNLSGYANTDRAEFIAECWSEYLNNPKPRETAKKVGELIEKLIRQRKTP